MSTLSQTLPESTSTASGAATSTASRQSALNWFEIPTHDLGRAQRFYEAVLGAPLRRQTLGSSELALFDYQEGSGVGGCLLAGTDAPAPSASGTLVYLDASPCLDTALLRVTEAGGRVLKGRVELPDGMGCYAHIEDSEGNCVGLHALP